MFSFSTFCESEDEEDFDMNSSFAAVFGQALTRSPFVQRRALKQAILDRKRDLDLIHSELEMMVEMLSGTVFMFILSIDGRSIVCIGNW